MSWDIYGNPLRRGHCEVHPHVHEEYPCSVCMAERNYNQQQPSYEIERLNYELDQQNDYIKELKAERDALAAQVEVLKDSINKCTVDGVALLRLSPELKQAVAATPRQYLAEIRAEAGVKGLRRGVALASGGDISLDCILVKIWSDGYAESVRQGGE